MPRDWLQDADVELPAEIEAAGADVLDVAFRVHTAIGPGALESVYQKCMALGLRKRGREVEERVWVDVSFEEEIIERVLQIDLLVDGAVVVEMKAVDTLADVHMAQLVSYLRLGQHPLGYLLNFHVSRMKAGIHRRINSRALPPSRPWRSLRSSRSLDP